MDSASASYRRQGDRWALHPQGLEGRAGLHRPGMPRCPPALLPARRRWGLPRGSPGFAVPRELQEVRGGQSRRHSEAHTPALKAPLCMALQCGTVHTPADKGRFVQCASLGTVAWSPSSGWVSGIPRAPTVAPTCSLKPPVSPETFGGERPRAFRSLEERGTHMSPRACADGSQSHVWDEYQGPMG